MSASPFTIVLREGIVNEEVAILRHYRSVSRRATVLLGAGQPRRSRAARRRHRRNVAHAVVVLTWLGRALRRVALSLHPNCGLSPTSLPKLPWFVPPLGGAPTLDALRPSVEDKWLEFEWLMCFVRETMASCELAAAAGGIPAQLAYLGALHAAW